MDVFVNGRAAVVARRRRSDGDVIAVRKIDVERGGDGVVGVLAEVFFVREDDDARLENGIPGAVAAGEKSADAFELGQNLLRSALRSTRDQFEVVAFVDVVLLRDGRGRKREG